MKKPSKFIKIVSLSLCFSLLFTQSGIAQLFPQLTPVLSQPLPLLRYLSVNQANPFNYFNFLLDKGLIPSQGTATEGSPERSRGIPDLNTEAKKLIHYFFLGITLPSGAFWVNLKPAEPERITSQELSKTDLGRVLLEQDLQLKKDTAKYLHPQHPKGKEYWQRLYSAMGKEKAKKAKITTSNRVWITPDEAVVLETEDGALVAKATLKVLLESEYLSLRTKRWNKEVEAEAETKDEIKALSESLMKELILPAITQEINTSATYAPLRQIYHSLILAEWYKQKIKNQISNIKNTDQIQSPYSYCIDKGYLKGLESELPWEKQTIWQEYLKSYQQGEYKLQDTLFGLKRMYWSGGVTFGELSRPNFIQTITPKSASPLLLQDLKQKEANLIPVLNQNSPIIGKEFNTTIQVIGTNREALLPDTSSISQSQKGASFAIKKEEPNSGYLPIEKKTDFTASSALGGIRDKFKRFIKGERLDRKILEEPSREELIAKPEDKPKFDKQEWVPFIPSKEDIAQERRKAFVYNDPSQGFFGVDLEYFVHAQTRLVEKLLSGDELNRVLAYLEIPKQKTEAEDRQRIIEELAKGNFSKEVFDLINGLSYKRQSLDIEVTKQSGRARPQGVYEAIANSLDALGFNIGQFGKGVKQIIDWLSPKGEDRVDVFTRKEGGATYQLTILKDKHGQNYIQIKEVSLKEFHKAAGQEIQRGTVVKITLKDAIPLKESQLNDRHRDSQEGIVTGIKKRFPYVTSVRITTQIGDNEPEEVNGFRAKEVIIPSGKPAYNPQDSKGRDIQVTVTDHTIKIVDNGIGMDAEVTSRMFVPKEGTKHPPPLSGSEAERECKDKVMVVQDKTLPHRVSFSRNGEVVESIDIPDDIHEDATVEGGLMVEFGSLLDVSESRDNIRIPTEIREEEKSNFKRALEDYAIDKIINHPNLSDVEKVKYINTIIVGLDGLIKGNENYAYTINNIRSYTKDALEPIIANLKRQGYIILPHERQFQKIDLQGKNAIYVHENLFNWQRAQSLIELGGEIVTLGGDKRLPLVAVPFTQDTLRRFRQFEREWHTWDEEYRHLVIKTDRFIAIPKQASVNLIELAQKRAKVGKLNEQETKEFNHLLQLINILSAQEVATSYEVTKPKENLRVAPEAEIGKSEGKIDSNAVNNFLVKPPIPAPSIISTAQIPQDAIQRYVLLDNGDLIEVGTEKVVEKNITYFEPLRNGYYRIIQYDRSSDRKSESVVKPDLGVNEYGLERGVVDFIDITEGDFEFIISPSKRYVAKRVISTRLYGTSVYVADLETGKMHNLDNDFSTTPLSSEDYASASAQYYDLQFSQDEKYLTYCEKLDDRRINFVVVDLESKKIINKLSLEESTLRAYAINPFANVVFIQSRDKDLNLLLDLETGHTDVGKFLHTDSSGTYTVIINPALGDMRIYFHKTKRIITQADFGDGKKKIDAVITKWKNGRAFAYGVHLENGNVTHFTEEGTQSVNPVVGEDYLEEFDANGNFYSPATSYVLNKNIDPLQRLNKQGAYKHPHFDLFIDNSDPENPVAIDPKTGEKFRYEGEIVDYIEKTNAFGGKENVLIVKADRGRAKGRLVGCLRIGDSGFLDFLSSVIGVSSNFVIGIKSSGDYAIYDLRNSNITSLSLITPQSYTSVSFDGKYFVFANPKTGDVVYVNPANPDEPIFVSSILQKAKPGNIPADANQKYIVINGDLVELGTGNRLSIMWGQSEVEQKIEQIEAVGKNYYKATTERTHYFFKIDRDAFPAVFSIDKDKGEIMLSPDKRLVFSQKKDGTIDSDFIFDLKTETRRFIFERDSTSQSQASSPLKDAASPLEELFKNSIYSGLQFTKDGKYMVYLKTDKRRHRKFLVIAETGEEVVVRNSIDLEDHDFEYAITPFANVVFVRDKETGGMTLLDLSGSMKNEPSVVVSGAKVLHTDSTGTYTAIIGGTGEMFIYLHKAKKMITVSDLKSFLGLNEIEIGSVSTGWDEEGKVSFVVSDELHPWDGVNFDEDGRLFREPSVHHRFFEIFTNEGKVYFDSLKFKLEMSPREIDPLQRLNKNGLYKHPDFDLFIDNSNPDNPVAIDPILGKSFFYQGKIVQYTMKKGFILFKTSDGELCAATEGEKIGSKDFDSTLYADITHSRFAIGILDGDFWIYDLIELSRTSFFAIDKLNNITPQTHTSVSFDGKYLVFVNPKTGDVVYLDPKAPQQPIFVSAQPQPTTMLTDQRPADAPNRVIIHRNAKNAVLLDSDSKEIYAITSGEIIERVNSNTFISRIDDTFRIFRIQDGKVESLWEYSKGDRIISYTDKLIVIEYERGHNEYQSVLDTRTGNSYSFIPRAAEDRTTLEKRSKKVHLSASGRFSIHRDVDGNLVYYDHNETTPTPPKLISSTFAHREYLVHQYADVVITGDNNDRYELYSLPLGKKLVSDADHIEIDSSGKVVVVKQGDRISAYRLPTYLPEITDTMLGGMREIRITSDNQYIYLIGIDPLGTVYNRKYDIVNTELLEILEQAPDIRFWESYDLEKKTIWDRETNGKPTVLQKYFWSEISYQENSSTTSDRSLLLFESTVLQYFGIPGVLGRACDVTNLETDDWWPRVMFEDERLEALKGGKVWYRIAQNGTIRAIRTGGKDYTFESNKTLVNQSKSFILEQKERATYLIDAQGEVRDITNHIPHNLALTDVNGDYFVFMNPQTKEIRYFNPAGIKGPISTQTTEVSPEVRQKQSEALALWNNQILPKRADFIAQAQAVYQPFLELIPEEFKAEIDQKIKGYIEKIYQEQEKEALKRFQDILDGKTQELGLDGALPFDRFQQRVSRFMEYLSVYARTISNRLSQEKHNVEKEFYLNLFTKLFELSINFDINLDTIDNSLIIDGSLFEALALGWKLESQEQFNATPLIIQFIQSLKQATSNQIQIAELKDIITFLSHFTSKDPIKNIPIVKEQFGKIFKLGKSAKEKYLLQLCDAFRSLADIQLAIDYLDKPDGYHKLGEAGSFVVFLTNVVEQVKKKERFVPQGKDIKAPADGVEISQIIKLEQQREEPSEDNGVMSIDYLIDRINNLPEPSEAQEAEILKNAKVQRESGAYTAEIAQNSRDATLEKQGELIIDFYRQDNGSGEEEYVEEASDNGTGALREVALIIPYSTKADAEQIEQTGYFGTGKYTIFEGADRVEIITKSDLRAFMFTFTVIRDASGNPTAIKLAGIREVSDEKVKQGVTVRRIKELDNTIPELDQMLAQRSWKIFAGLSQNENFRIYFIDHEGKRISLSVEKEVLSETDFKAVKPREDKEVDFGKFRIISAKDMPLQIVDKAGLRVSEIKEEYLELIPAPLRRHIKEMGIIIQIPLPLIRNRSAFEYENEYLPIIQKYVAIELYKAIAFLTLTKTDPQFVFEGFPLDWETNDSYWSSIDLNDSVIVNVAQKINESRHQEIINNELENLLIEKGRLDKEKRFVKLLLLLKVSTDKTKPESKTSLLLRRLAIQKEIDKARAERQAAMLEKVGFKVGDVPSVKDVPHHRSKLGMALGIVKGHEQMKRAEDYIVPAETASERELMDLAYSIAKRFGIGQVLLVSHRAEFAGAFIHYKNEFGKRVPTMLINQSLAHLIGRPEGTFQDRATETIVHELAHLLEEFMRSDTVLLSKDGYVAHLADFTHDAVGTFAEAMKYISAVTLVNRAMLSSLEQEKPSTGFPVKESASSAVEEIPEQCVTGDTLLPILSNDGRWTRDEGRYILKPIVEVKPGDYALSLNEETQAIEPHRIKGLLDMGVKPVYKLTTASSKTLKTTLNHPYLTKQGWKKLKEIEVGDEIAVTGKNRYSFPEDINDGRDGVLRGTAQKHLLLEAVKQCLKPPRDWLPFQFSSFGGQITTPKVATMLISNHETTLIPNETFRKSEAIFPANQRGKMPPIKVWETKRLLSLFQNVSFSTKFILSQSNSLSSLFLKDAFAENALSDILWDRIISIEPLGRQQVFDIEVEGTHNFLAQGIVAHNTYIQSDQLPVTSDQKPEESAAGSPTEDEEDAMEFLVERFDFAGIGNVYGFLPTDTLYEAARSFVKDLFQSRSSPTKDPAAVRESLNKISNKLVRLSKAVARIFSPYNSDDLCRFLTQLVGDYKIAVINFLISEDNEVLSDEKAAMITYLLEISPSREIFELIKNSAEQTKHAGRLKFYRGIKAILKNKGMVDDDTPKDWQLLLNDYINRFGYLASRSSILVHRYLYQGVPLDDEKIKDYRVSEIGITSTGIKGMEELEKVIKNTLSQLINKRGIDEANLENPIIEGIIGEATGFYAAEFGHGSYGERKLKEFVQEFNKLEKQGEIPNLDPAFNQEEEFMVRKLGRIEVTQDAQKKFEEYMWLIKQAVSLSERPVDIHIKQLKEKALKILESKQSELKDKLTTSEEKVKRGIEIQMNNLRGSIENLNSSQFATLLNLAIAMAKQKELQDIVALILLAETLNNTQHTIFRQAILDAINEGISILSLQKIVELKDVFVKEHTLKDLDKNTRKALLNVLNIRIFEEELSMIKVIQNDGIKVRAFATKGILGEMAGDIGDACYTTEDNIMARKKPSPITAIIFTIGEDLDTEFIGSMLILENTIKSRPVFILRALNPSVKFLSKYSAEDFLENAIKYAEKIAKKKGVELIVAPIGSAEALSNRQKIKSIFPKFVKGGRLDLDKEESFSDYNITIGIVAQVASSSPLMQPPGQGRTGQGQEKSVSKVINAMPYRPGWIDQEMTSQLEKDLSVLLQDVSPVFIDRKQQQEVIVSHNLAYRSNQYKKDAFSFISKKAWADAKYILKNGFDWNRLNYWSDLLGKGIWCSPAKWEKNTIESGREYGPILNIHFEGNIIGIEQEQEIRKRIKLFLESNFQEAQKVIPYRYGRSELEDFLFDFLCVNFDIGAVNHLQAGAGHVFVIKNPLAIKSIEIANKNPYGDNEMVESLFSPETAIVLARPDIVAESEPPFVTSLSSLRDEQSTSSGVEEIPEQCVTGDTLLPILSNDGRRTRDEGRYILKPIVEVKPGDYVLSLNEETQQIEPHRIKGLLDMGVKPVYKLTTASGRSIKTTANHPYLTKGGWIKVSELKAGDEIGVARKLFGPDSDFTFLNNEKLAFKLRFSKFLKQVKGVINDFFSLHIFNIDNCYAEGVSYIKPQHVAKVFVKSEQDMIMSQGVIKNLFIRSSPQIGFNSSANLKTAISKRLNNVPVNALVSKNSHREKLGLRDYLSGMFHKFRGVFNSSNNVFFANIRILLGDIFYRISGGNEIEDIGYSNAGSLNTGFTKPDFGVNYNSFFIHSTATSIIKNNTQSVLSQDNSGIVYESIASIEYLGPQRVYDIEVEGTHNFIGNGILAHNTYIQQPITAGSPTQSASLAPSEVEGSAGVEKTQCVTADTLLPILSNDGRRTRDGGRYILKPIVEVKPGDYALSLNEETQRIEPHRIKGLLDMGVKPVYKLTTASGRSIKTTANHPYYVRAQKKSIGEWLKVSELKAGDEIGVAGSENLSAINLFAMPDFNNENTTTFPVKDNPIISNLETIRSNGTTGYSFSKGKRIGLFKIMFNFQKDSLPDIFGQFQKHPFSLGSEIIGDHLRPAFFLTSSPETRPDLRDASSEARNSGLDASISSSISSTVSLSNTNPSVLPFLSTKRTIPSNKKDSFATLDGSKSTIFSSDSPFNNDAIIFSPPASIEYNTSYFNLSRLFLPAEAEAAEIVTSAIFWDKIISIEPIGLEQVYDIEVEGTHNFIGNGILAHNTYIQQPITAGSPAAKESASLAPSEVEGSAEKKEASSAAVRATEAANAGLEEAKELGGIDLSQIELTLKDEKFVSSLNPADLKILRAAKALKDEWNSLSLLYVHEIILLLKDNLVKEIQNREILFSVLKQLQIKEFLDPQATQLLRLLQLDQSLAEIKLTLAK